MRCALFWDVNTAQSGKSVPTFRYNLSVPYLTKKSRAFWTACLLNMGQYVCPETSVRNSHSTLRNIPEERRSQ